MNSINWPALHVWVFIAELVEHCSANAEATGSNPVEAPKISFRANSSFSRRNLLRLLRLVSAKLQCPKFVQNAERKSVREINFRKKRPKF